MIMECSVCGEDTNNKKNGIPICSECIEGDDNEIEESKDND